MCITHADKPIPVLPMLSAHNYNLVNLFACPRVISITKEHQMVQPNMYAWITKALLLTVHQKQRSFFSHPVVLFVVMCACKVDAWYWWVKLCIPFYKHQNIFNGNGKMNTWVWHSDGNTDYMILILGCVRSTRCDLLFGRHRMPCSEQTFWN